MENLVLFEREGQIGVLKVNRPNALNALNRETIQALDDKLAEIEALDNLRALIVTGEGKAFVAGADIAEMSKMNLTEAKAFAMFGQRVFRRLEKLPIVTIAAVNGFALGGGMELAMSCDLRYAAERAKMGQPEVSLGITPGFAGTQRLAKLVGPALAKEYIFTGRMIKAEEAKRVGLINDYAEDALAMAKEVANQIVVNAPIAVRYAKSAIDLGVDATIDNGAEIEANLFAQCFTTEDQKSGMQAFLNKEKPAYQNK